MGLQPVGLVQGYYCGQIGSWSNYSYYPERNYPCACYEQAPHNPGWVGRLGDLDGAWMDAHATALSRMLKEASDLGAHGVVGVKTDMSHPTNENSAEVHLYGTAVVVTGAAAPQQPWSTQLAGHKLAKLIEIGFVPGSVAYSRCTAMMAEGCYMEYYGSGRCGTGYVINPLQDAHELARKGAIAQAKQILPDASLYDVRMEVQESERYHSTYITCSLLGSLVRRARSTSPVARPVPTVSVGS
jgi:Putative heavy-metal-binding